MKVPFSLFQQDRAIQRKKRPCCLFQYMRIFEFVNGILIFLFIREFNPVSNKKAARPGRLFVEW